MKTTLFFILTTILLLPIVQFANGTQSSLVISQYSNPLSVQSDSYLQGFGHGILKFNKNLVDDSTCNYIKSKPEIKIVNRQKESLLNLDEKTRQFFIILGTRNSTSYQYLQIGLDDFAGQVSNLSYIVNLKKYDQPLMGGLYQGYTNLVVALESDKDSSRSPEDNYKKYIEGASKDITSTVDRLGPGKYDLHAILFESDNSYWINHDACAISLHWNISVDDKGEISAVQPKAEIGKVRDVTKEFPPLQQNKKGVNAEDIKCSEGLMLVTKKADNSPACVNPLTYNKLVERGWANLQGNTYTFYVFANDIKYEIPYHVTGWKNKILNMTVDTEANSFLVSIQTKNSGDLTVTFPKLFLDSTMEDIDGFFVLVDGEEAPYEEKIGELDRTLSIKFPENTTVIEIIGIKLI